MSLVAGPFSLCDVADERQNDGLSGIFEVTRINRYKTITANESAANANVVYIQPGEPVVVTRFEPDAGDTEDDDAEGS